ncbi:MAG: sigma-54-dependent Fis family transcriptional regulator [Sulfuritalea sp.]|nr:sigma-54-dependent Fis family transcriptional regulator [Sulfuritalea sp.]
MRTSLPIPALRRARKYLLEHGECLADALDDRIARSWRRSLDAGLVADGRVAEAVQTCGGELGHLLARNHELLSHSRPVMEHLFEQIRDTQSMVILADNRGTLMHTLGDAEFVCKAERVTLSCGASWHEQHRGTNAIGTALVEAAVVEVHGAEHFLERNGFLTCAAAPIMSGSGELAGILDISGDSRLRHPHTRGLIGIAARMIENRLLVAGCRDEFRLHLHPQAEGIGTIGEGIVVLAPDGRIVGANRRALELLRVSRDSLGVMPFGGAFDASLDELLANGRRRHAPPVSLRLHDGSAVFAKLHVGSAASAECTRAGAGSRDPAIDDALARLDTGDLRWRSAADRARRVSGKPIPLLIQGESGVGKELFARAIHDSGPRRAGPFIAINCAAVPENLIEAELFGYASGAYTGARRDGSPGRIREANGGTLFLDEIGDMPLAMQSRLLRVLQERQVTPLGGGRPVDVDFSLICASHRNLRQSIEQGSFRSDLYYRINGLSLKLPALRERGDFMVLTRRLLDSLNLERDVDLAPELQARFRQYHWPGNLRQYASVLRTASAMLDPQEDCIDWQHMPDDIVEELLAPAEQSTTVLPQPEPERMPENLRELSRSAVRQALEGSRGNVSEAARRLGISRQTLYRKLNDGPRAAPGEPASVAKGLPADGRRDVML